MTGSLLADFSSPPLLGETVAARYEGDSNWYRGRIVEVNDDFQFVVHFHDLGFQEPVGLDNMRQIAPEFLHLPVQATKFFLFISPVIES
jgi:hypothetical protein